MIQDTIRSKQAVSPLTNDFEIELEDLPVVSKIGLKNISANNALPKDWNSHAIESLNSNEELSPTVHKSQSVGARILSWAVNTPISVWATVNVLKSIRFWMLLGAPSRSTRNQTDKKLDEITGSLHLAKAIHALSPQVASWLQDKLVALKLTESVSVFLKNEHPTLETFVDVLLPVIYLNIAKSVHNAGDDDAAQKAVSMADVTAFMCEIVNRHLPNLNQRFALIEKTIDPEKRNRVIGLVFAPMVDEILAIALPNGVNDLPLIKLPVISQSLWQTFQKNLLPVLFFEVYKQLASPKDEKERLDLLERKGESLVSLAAVIGSQASELFPSLISEATVENKNNEITIVRESPVVTIIRKSFSSLLLGSDQLKTWLGSWFTKELILVGKSENYDLKQIWKLVGGYLEPMLIYIFSSMSESESLNGLEKKPQSAIGTIIVKFLTIVNRFYHTYFQKIQQRLDQLKMSGENPEEDKVLLRIFDKLAQDALTMMGLNAASKIPLPSFIKDVFLQHVKSMAPEFLFKQFMAFKNISINNDETRKKLRSLLFDPKNLENSSVTTKVISELYGNKACSTLNMFHQFYQSLWQESGTERIAKTLEAMCAASSSKLVTAIIQQYDPSLSKEGNNQFLLGLHEKFTLHVETMLLEMLVHVIENVEDNEKFEMGKHPKYLLVINALLQIHHMVGKQFNEIGEELGKIRQKYDRDSEAYRNAATQLFSDLAEKLHRFFGVDPFKHLPLQELPGGDSLKAVLLSSFKKNILPDVLYKLYAEATDWQAKLQESLSTLDQTYHTSHPKWACKVLAQYSTDFIRHYLNSSNDAAAKLLLTGLKDYFSQIKNSSGGYVSETFEERKEDVESLISKNLQTVATTDDPEFAAFWPALNGYLEAIVAKFFAQFSTTIREIESENPDLTVDIATQILKETAEHFSIVTRVTEESGVDESFQVPLADMLLAFGKELHPGIPANPSDSEEVKDQIRLQGCFVPLAKKMLELANLTLEDFPIPSFMRQQVGDMLVNKILPLVLMRAYQKAFEPQVRNSLMLNFIQTLYVALNGVQAPKRENDLEEASTRPDPKKKDLYETCGAVVLELIKLIPDTAVQYVFMKEKVKNMSAEAIGDAIMPYLSRWTLLQMIDSMIYSGLPSFHPAKWEGKLGREDLVPRKAFVRPDGKMELKPVKDFKFDFSSTQAELTSMEEAKIKEAFKVRLELRNGFTKTISQQLHAKVWAVIKSLWTSLQDQLNDFIERLFPEKGLRVKSFLDKIFSKVFFDIIGSVIEFLASPFIAFSKFITEKTMINTRSENIIENLQSEILENLFYKWSDSVVDTLIRLQKNTYTGTVEEA